MHTNSERKNPYKCLVNWIKAYLGLRGGRGEVRGKMVTVLVLFAVLVKCVSGGFFDIMDLDDPLSAIWSNNKQLKKTLTSDTTSYSEDQEEFKNIIQNSEEESTECKVTTPSGVKYGVCTSAPNCLLSGGLPNQKCHILSTCCTFERTCGKSSSSKVSYFEGDDIKIGRAKQCRFTVKLKNPNVCQVRLDFVKFQLAPAIPTSTIITAGQKIYKCVTDRMVVSPNYYGIPEFCGNNDNQHVYVHVNQSDGITKGVNLDLILTDRGGNPNLISPSWKIKITQLECPIQRGKFTLTNKNADEAAQDFNLLAPLGAIQYFTDKIGYIKSFGYDGTIKSSQSYTYDQFYAIAFKRYHDTCGVKFNPDYIKLPHSVPTDQFGNDLIYKDDDCYHYIFVPELSVDQTLPSPPYDLVSRMCTDENREFRSYAPGPLQIYFKSLYTKELEDVDPNDVQGFNIRYELLQSCP